MLRKETLSVAIAAISTLVLLIPSVAANAQSNNKPVKVDVKCPSQEDGKFTISVKPFTVVVDSNEGVEWDLDIDDKKNEYIEISAKDSSNWLFMTTTSKKNKKVVMTQRNPNATGDTFYYQISVWCGDETVPVVLDPRVKVGGGGTGG